MSVFIFSVLYVHMYTNLDFGHLLEGIILKLAREEYAIFGLIFTLMMYFF